MQCLRPHITLVIALLMLLGVRSAAQTSVSTKGRDFWFTFMQNDPSNPLPQMNIFITADSATTAQVYVGTTFVQNVVIAAGSAQRVDLTGTNAVLAYQATSNVIAPNRAVHVVAQRDVTVYAFNTLTTSTDAYIILPTPTLGDEYVTMNIPENTPMNRRSQIAVVGVASGTVVEITPRSVVRGTPNRPANVPFTITLNAGDVFQFQSAGGDLTGTRIRVLTATGACNPVAVFSGHQRTALPQIGAGGHDHLIEQIPPTRALGQDFVVMPIQSSNPNGNMIIRVVASEPATQVTFNGGAPATLVNVGDFTEFQVSMHLPYRITSTRPILVAQFAMSYSVAFTNQIGDPFMALVPPVEQFIDRFTFNAFVPQVPGQSPAMTAAWTNNMYVNILARTADINAITVGGVQIGTMTTNAAVAPTRLKHQVVPGTDLSFVTLRVAPGIYVVDATAGEGCAGMVYGYSTADSYGFAGGSSITNLRAEIRVLDSLPCPGRPVAMEGFSRDSNVITQWQWTFPFDGSTFTTKVISKTFPGPGVFRAQLVLIKNGCALDTIIEDIEIRTPITTTVDVAPSQACPNDTVRLTAHATGSVGPYRYQWSALDASGFVSGTTDSVLSVLHATGGAYRYQLVTTDAGGCLRTDTITVEILTPPSIAPIDPVLVCQGATTTVTAVVTPLQGTTLRWSAVNASDDSTIVGDRTSVSVSIRGITVGAHTYRMTATDANGCVSTRDVVVDVIGVPQITNAGSDPVIRCLESNIPPITIGDSLSITGGVAPYSYVWTVVSGDAGSITGSTTTQTTTVRPTVTTVYRLTVRGSDSRIDCPVSIDIVVQVRLVPDANAGPDRVICLCRDRNGVSIGLDALCGRAPYSYSWTPTTALSNPASVTTAQTNANPATTTIYVLTVRDADGGENRDTVVVFVEECPVVQLTPVTLCSDDRSARIPVKLQNVSPDSCTFRWTPSTFLDDPTLREPTHLAADSTYAITYVVEVTTTKGCMTTDSVIVSRSFGLTVDAVASASCESDTICRGDTVRFSAIKTGGALAASFTWTSRPSDASVQNDAATGNAVATPLVTTTYVVRVVDTMGCEATDSITVCVDPVPNAFAGTDTAICFSDAGRAPVQRGARSSCGKEPFVYEWQPANLVRIPDPNQPWLAELLPTQSTMFILRVTDNAGQGASTEDTLIVTVRPPITIAFTPSTVDLCRGEADVPLEATATDGTAPYVYEWSINNTVVQTSPPSTSSALPATVLAALTQNALIRVRVTDALGCVGEDSITVIVREAPTLTMTSSYRICPCDSVQIGALAQGGTPFADGSYRYVWRESIEETEDGRSSISNDSIAQPFVSPRSTTTYTVIAIDSAGCTSMPFNVTVEVDRPGAGTVLRPLDVRADPRSESVALPIDVVAGPEQITCPPDRLEFTLTYDEMLFDPVPTADNATIIDNTVRSDPDSMMVLRSIRVRMSPAPSLTTGSRITSVRGRALLGEPGTTQLVVSDVMMIWDCDTVSLTSEPGTLTLDSLCVVDGNARLLGNRAAQIQRVLPNPNGGTMTVLIEHRVAMKATLSVIDASGVDVHTVTLDALQPGADARRVVLMTLDLPSGTYRLVLRAAEAVSVQPFTIIR